MTERTRRQRRAEAVSGFLAGVGIGALLAVVLGFIHYGTSGRIFAAQPAIAEPRVWVDCPSGTTYLITGRGGITFRLTPDGDLIKGQCDG